MCDNKTSCGVLVTCDDVNRIIVPNLEWLYDANICDVWCTMYDDSMILNKTRKFHFWFLDKILCVCVRVNVLLSTFAVCCCHFFNQICGSMHKMKLSIVLKISMKATQYSFSLYPMLDLNGIAASCKLQAQSMNVGYETCAADDVLIRCVLGVLRCWYAIERQWLDKVRTLYTRHEFYMIPYADPTRPD